MNSGEAKLAVFCAFGVGGGLWIFFSAFKRLRLRRAVSGTPTSKARSAAMGKCELKGIAREIDLPILGPFSGQPCVWYRWKVEEERRDSRGNASWHTVDEKYSVEPFFLEDATGRLRIHPDGAEVEAPRLLEYTNGLFSSKDQPQGKEAAGWLNYGRRRLSEWRIGQAMPVYALGVLRSEKTAGTEAAEAFLAAGREGEPFFISTRSEDEVLSELFWSVWGRMLLGAALCVGGCAGLAEIFYQGL